MGTDWMALTVWCIALNRFTRRTPAVWRTAFDVDD